MTKYRLRKQGPIVAEYNRVVALLKRTPDGKHREALYGAQQALAWALNNEAMRASKCFGLPPSKPSSP